MSKYTFGMTAAASDWFDHYEEEGNVWDEDEHFFNSQDQIYALLYGLAFVRKFVPPYVVAKDASGNVLSFQDGHTSLNTEAWAIADRIVLYAKHAWSCENGNSCQGIQYNWHITIPNCVLPDKPSTIGADFGGGTYTYPMAEAACMIAFNSWGDKNEGFFIGSAPMRCMTYHNLTSSTWGYNAWDAFIGNIPPDFTTSSGGLQESRIFGGLLNAVCYCSYNVYGLHNSTRNRVDALARAAAQQYYYDLPYALAVLHNLKVKDAFRPGGESISGLINIMNKCAHYDFGNGNWSSFEWSTTSRLEHQERIGDVAESQFYAEYSALDFLLYHNLWYLYNKKQPGSSGVNTYVADLGDVLIDKNNAYFADNINAYETCVMKNTQYMLYAYGQFNYIKAGKAIVFKPGTHIYAGKGIQAISDGTVLVSHYSGLRAYINGFTCADDYGSYYPSIDPSNPYRTLPGNDSSSVSSKNEVYSAATPSYPDADNPYHYVEYPSEEINTSPIPQKEDNFENIPLLPVSNSSLGSFLVYPNPFENEINIHFHKFGNVIIRVFDVTGKLVFETKTNNSNETDKTLSLKEHLISGVYIIQIEYEDGVKDMCKLVKH